MILDIMKRLIFDFTKFLRLAGFRVNNLFFNKRKFLLNKTSLPVRVAGIYLAGISLRKIFGPGSLLGQGPAAAVADSC